jgi:hypothetical protein
MKITGILGEAWGVFDYEKGDFTPTYQRTEKMGGGRVDQFNVN